MSSDQPRPQIPGDMKAFNAKLIDEFRANRGELSGQMKGTRLMLLTTTGARSGQPRTVVLGYRVRGEDYIAIASNNGADTQPSWYTNLSAEPAVLVEIGDERFSAHARVASADERIELAPLIDYLPRQQQLTKREIPIVIFARDQAQGPFPPKASGSTRIT